MPKDAFFLLPVLTSRLRAAFKFQVAVAVADVDAHGERLYHLGLKNVRRSTLADANNRRDAGMFESLFYSLLDRCRDLPPKHRFRFKNPMFSIDATTIDLCLASFPWAKFRKTKGAIKLHCQYDHSGALPSFMVISDGKRHEARVVKEHSFPLTPDSIVSVDRGYIDFKWLYIVTDKFTRYIDMRIAEYYIKV